MYNICISPLTIGRKSSTAKSARLKDDGAVAGGDTPVRGRRCCWSSAELRNPPLRSGDHRIALPRRRFPSLLETSLVYPSGGRWDKKLAGDDGGASIPRGGSGSPPADANRSYLLVANFNSVEAVIFLARITSSMLFSVGRWAGSRCGAGLVLGPM